MLPSTKVIIDDVLIKYVKSKLFVLAVILTYVENNLNLLQPLIPNEIFTIVVFIVPLLNVVIRAYLIHKNT